MVKSKNKNNFFQESRQIFNTFYEKQKNKESDKNPKIVKKAIRAPDEFISFRHVKPFDSENLDLLEEDNEDLINLNVKSSSENSQLKFNEILTGSEVIKILKL